MLLIVFEVLLWVFLLLMAARFLYWVTSSLINAAFPNRERPPQSPVRYWGPGAPRAKVLMVPPKRSGGGGE